MVAWVWATHQSSGTGGTSCAAISFLTSRLPTCGPLPWVSTTGTPVATTAATCRQAAAIASRCAAGVAEPSGPVIALPPRAMTTRPGVTPRTVTGFLSALKYPSAAPEVEGVPPGAEARGLDDVHREVEVLPHARRLVGVAAEADRLAALLEEPAHLVDRVQRAGRVHLHRPAGASQRPEHPAVLLLVVLLGVPVAAAGPVPPREVDVGEHLEDVAALDHVDHLGQVAAHRRVRVGIEQPADAVEPAVLAQRVQRAEHPVDGGVAQVGGDAGGEQVGLAGLHARPDPQLGEALPALLQLGEVALDVDGQVPGGVQIGRAHV